MFNLSYLTKIRDKVLEDFKVITAQLDEHNLTFQNNLTRLSEKEAQLEQGNKALEDFEKNKVKTLLYFENLRDGIKEKISGLGEVSKENLKEIELEGKELSRKYEALQEQKTKLGNIKSKISSTKATLVEVTNQITNFKFTEGDRCGYCHSIITDKNKLKELKVSETSKLKGLTDRKTSLISTQEDLQKQLTILAKGLEEEDNIYKDLMSKRTQYALLKDRIKTYQSYQEELANILAKIENQKDLVFSINIQELEDSINNLKLQIKPQKVIVQNLFRKRDLYKWLINEPFSGSGLKAYLFEFYLQQLNSFLRSYHSLVGFIPQIEMELGGARKNVEVNIYRGDQVIPFSDLSGGQGQLINVLIAFAQNDIVLSNQGINILFLDEVFENLDTSNVEKVGELILLEKASKVHVNLITHHEVFNTVGAEVIVLG